MTLKLIAVLALLVAPGAVAQRTTADSLTREAIAAHPEEYAAEARAFRDLAGRVSRRLGQLRIRLSTGRLVTFTDTLDDTDRYQRFVYVGFLPKAGVHLVETSFYEGGTFHIVHDRSGQDATIPGKPLWSPDGARFASASSDLEAGYDPNALEIWRVDARRLTREYLVDGGQKWGPEDVAWVSPTRLRYVRMTLAARDNNRHVPTESLSFRDGRWERQTTTR